MSAHSTWLRRSFVSLAGLSTAAVLASGCGVVKCGEGTIESDGQCVPGTANQEPAIKVTVSSLRVDHDGTQSVYANHPVRFKVGLTSEGKKSLVALNVALHPKNDTMDAKGCYLGGADAVLTGTKDEQIFDLEFIVPHVCKEGAYNPVVTFDSTGGAPPLRSNVVIFNDASKDKAENKGCKGANKAGDEAPCLYDLNIKNSPGLDYSLAYLSPLSNVGVQYVTPPAGPDAIPGAPEIPEPFLRANWTILTMGKDIDDPSGMTRAAPLKIRYFLRAVKDKTNVGWKLLNFGPEPDPKDPTKLINPDVRTIKDFQPGVKYQNSNNIYLVDQFDLVIKGDWRTEEEFYIKGCLETDAPEIGDPVYAGDDGRGNNCVTFPIRIVRALPPAQAASSQAFNFDWSKVFGDKKYAQFTGAVSSTNVLDLSGAHLTETMNARIDSDLLGNLTLVDAKANAEAFVAGVGSHVDASVTVYTWNLFSFSKVFPDRFEWKAPNLSWAKMFNFNFKYYALPKIGGVDITFGAAGSASLDAGLTIYSRAGSDKAPFDKSQKVGAITGKVTPGGKLDATFSAKFSLLGVSGEASGNAQLVDASMPLTADLLWGLTKVQPATLTVFGRVNWHQEFTSMGGKVDVKVTDVPFLLKWAIKPGTYNIFQMEVSKRSADLLNRQAQVDIGG